MSSLPDIIAKAIKLEVDIKGTLIVKEEILKIIIVCKSAIVKHL